MMNAMDFALLIGNSEREKNIEASSMLIFNIAQNNTNIRSKYVIKQYNCETIQTNTLNPDLNI